MYKAKAKARPFEASSIFSIQSEPRNSRRSFNKVYPEMPRLSTNAICHSIEIQSPETDEWEDKSKRFSFRRVDRSQTIQQMLEPDDHTLPCNFEDGRVSRVEYEKLQIIDASVALFAMIGIMLAVFSYDVEFHGNDVSLLNTLQYSLIISTIVLIGVTFIRYQQKIKYLKVRGLLSTKDNLLTSGEIFKLLTEILIFLLQPYPCLQRHKVTLYSDLEATNYFYFGNDFFCLLIILRLYTFFRLLLNNTMYRSPRARRLTIMYGANNHYLYACKCIMKEKPLPNVLFGFFASVVIFGYMVRVCERPLNRYHPEGVDFNNYLNAMWCVVVTMTTVGYGDYYPRTHVGRFVTLLVCLWGVFIVSLMVVTLNNILTLSNVEEKSLTVLKRLELRKEVQKEAAYVLTNMAKISLTKRKIKERELARKRNWINAVRFKKHAHYFKDASRKLTTEATSGNMHEEMHRRFDIMGDVIHEMSVKQDKLEDLIKNLTDVMSTFQSAKDLPSLGENLQKQDSSSANTLKAIE